MNAFGVGHTQNEFYGKKVDVGVVFFFFVLWLGVVVGLLSVLDPAVTTSSAVCFPTNPTHMPRGTM